MTAYQLDHQWQNERARLASIEQLFDPFIGEVCRIGSGSPLSLLWR